MEKWKIGKKTDKGKQKNRKQRIRIITKTRKNRKTENCKKGKKWTIKTDEKWGKW